jgi:hypothetical protein
VEQFLTWLIQNAGGPALVNLPVTWAASDLAAAAGRWFRRRRHSDGLSRIVRAATGDDDCLSDAEFAAVRGLLEQESTWVLVGRGTVDDLAERIASCLTGRAGTESSLAAGRAIAAGLLEFAVRDLEPDLFPQVLFARLDRMQADQARALDEAMAAVHADLAAFAVHRGVADADSSARLMSQLGRVLDSLPGPADQSEVAVYLTVLSGWLNTTDPWLSDGRAGGMALPPASVERKLALASDGHDVEDADELARRCNRLVVLGGPGSGKTWLARRAARLCAEAALDALEAGATVDEVELPLYTTCATLAEMPSGDVIRRAVVSSALSLLPDMGGVRLTDSVQMLFEKRNGPTLLVADSLDEARGADKRVRLADSLPADWRILLTSRPASWRGQLTVSGADAARQVRNLHPLRYPEDVEPIINRWFSGRAAQAEDLRDQLRGRAALQQAATVPLILAFYCIVGGDEPLPGRRAELYDTVIRKMLAGPWHGIRDRDVDPDACLDTLRNWAWSAAARNPLSLTGVWADEFPTLRAKNHTPDERDALDRVATPLGPADDKTGLTQRRFAHRTIREHLVAEHIAETMPAEAAAELVNHIWYDPDWEYSAPGALAMHDKREQVLAHLIGRVTGGSQPYADLAARDRCLEIRRFLARVAQESAEDDWLPELAAMIGQARLDVAATGPVGICQVAASHWPTSNRPILQQALGLFADAARSEVALELAQAVARLAVTAEDRAAARKSLLTMLAGSPNDPRAAPALAEAVAALNPTALDRATARQTLLAVIRGPADPAHTPAFVKAVVGLAVTAEDREAVRKELLAILTARPTGPLEAASMAEAVAALNPTASDRGAARQALLAMLSAQDGLRWAHWLAQAVVGLAATTEHEPAAREELLAVLAAQADRGAETNPWGARTLTEAVTALNATAGDRAAARRALLTMLATSDPRGACALAEAVAALNPTPSDRTAAQNALLAMFRPGTYPGTALALAKALGALDPSTEQRATARQALLANLAAQTDSGWARGLAMQVAGLAISAEDRTATRQVMLAMLSAPTDPWTARALAEAVAALDPTPKDQESARQALLTVLREADPWKAVDIAQVLAVLDPTPEDQAAARRALLAILTTKAGHGPKEEIANAIAWLDPTPDDQAAARRTLLAVLTEADPWKAVGDPWKVVDIAQVFAVLDPTPADQAAARRWRSAR